MIEEAKRQINTLFQRHQRAVLGFSGGKDSLALLDLLSDYRDRLTLVWVNTGAMAPHMVEFVRGSKKDYELCKNMTFL